MRRFAWRSPRFFAEPGLYPRLWGKWYRVINLKDYPA